MKIPRLTSGPLCYTLQEWAIRMAFSDLSVGILVSSVCFYLSTAVGKYTTLEADNVEVTRSWLIAIAVIFLLPVLFAIVLIGGLWNRKKILLLIWVFYGLFANVAFFAIFLALSIFSFIKLGLGSGFVILLVCFVIAGHGAYSILVVYNIYLNIKEEEEKKQSESWENSGL